MERRRRSAWYRFAQQLTVDIGQPFGADIAAYPSLDFKARLGTEIERDDLACAFAYPNRSVVRCDVYIDGAIDENPTSTLMRIVP